MMRHWTCRQLIVLVCIGTATYLALTDDSFRASYMELITFVVGGYLGQQLPQSAKK